MRYYAEERLNVGNVRAISADFVDPQANRAPLGLVGGVAALILVWTLVTVMVKQAHFAVFAPTLELGMEGASAFAKLFGAFVLSLLSADKAETRLTWVASGFLILGLGGFGFGFLEALLAGETADLNTAAYESLVVRIIASVLFVIGLISTRPPQLPQQVLLILLFFFGFVGLILQGSAHLLPPLIRITDLEVALVLEEAPTQWLTNWHWILSPLPLGLTIVAGWGAARQSVLSPIGRWLVVAMVLLAGAQVHALFWPVAYGPVLTTADVLRLTAAAVIAVGGVIELRRIAAEHTRLLAVEQEHSRRLRELAVLKADFTAMVAHELGSPLAAIRGLSDMLATGELSPDEQIKTLSAIKAETNLLNALVADVQSAAIVERDDFQIERQAVPVAKLIENAAVFARTLPNDHPVRVRIMSDAHVWADSERIGQVLRNLLNNAAKYSPVGAPIALRALPTQNGVRLEVADCGPGIHPDDLSRIFDKFGRGRNQANQKVAGVGLGLYLSRRIVQAHGADLTVTSKPGEGSIFAFELEVAP